ncbi:MAG: protein kinase family protein [Spirochaetales bacterium]|nr:protein kinase family protein [Spirochaetales bacterium]
MEFIFELGGALFEGAAELFSHPYVVYGVSLLGLVALFILRSIGQRLAEDIYRFLKSLFLGSKSKKPLPAAEGVSRSSQKNRPQQPQQERYRLGELLGANQRVALYAATTATGEKVFFKQAVNRSSNDWLSRESRILTRLWDSGERFRKQLPHLVEHFLTRDGLAVNVFESIAGFDLEEIRKRYPQGIPERHVIWLWRRILAVIGHAHSQGILHGNIEPSHILVRPADHNVWLIDWSYAIDNPARTRETFRIENRPYTAPEVTARANPLPSSDMYSIGQCMLYVLGGDPASGRMPEGLDERLVRLLRLFTLPTVAGRPADAWEMYNRLDLLRAEMYGPHEFIEFRM